MPFTHCSGNSDSFLCFLSIPAGLLQLPACWLSSAPHWQVAKSSEIRCMTCLQGKREREREKKITSNSSFIGYASGLSGHILITGTGPLYLWTSLNVCTLSLEISVPPQIHAFLKFFVPVPRHMVRDHFYVLVPLVGMTFHTVTAILTVGHHLDRLWKVFQQVSNLP